MKKKEREEEGWIESEKDKGKDRKVI